MSPRDPTENEVRDLIRTELGLEVDVLYADRPCIHGWVSLGSFGLVGGYIVFKHQGRMVASPVMLGLPYDHEAKAA